MDFKKLINTNFRDVEEYLVGKKVVLKNNLRDFFNQYSTDEIYLCDDMIKFAGKTVEIEKILKNCSYNDCPSFRFVEDSDMYTWSFEWVDYIIDETIFIEDNTNTGIYEFKKGDLVRIKSRFLGDGELVDTDTDYCGIPVKNYVVDGNSKKTGRKLVICDIIDGKVLPYFLNDNYDAKPITLDMIELEEKDYVENIKKLKEKRGTVSKTKQKVLDDIEIIEEMKSKVNIKDFRKIYAGSMKKIPNNLKGVEQIIHHWACNKKHLYRLLGNKLSISREFEYLKEEKDVKQDRENLYRAFPGTYYFFKRLLDSEILTNKLTRNYDCYNTECLTYSHSFSIGDKVSKMVDEMFHNEKLNMAFSDIIAQNKIKGIVEISIDPIEYLLASCNQSGWNSCHRMFQVGTTGYSYGQWSAGVLSYMCDDVSMIAFRHNGKLFEYKINNQKVQAHSKNWRQMVWINKDFNEFIYSRQYPNRIEKVTKIVREMLEEQIDNNIECEKNWVHSTDKSKMKNIVADNNNLKSQVLHYNDVLHDFQADLCYKKELELKNNSIKVGSNPICPNCGNEVIINHSYPECNHCHNNRN